MKEQTELPLKTEPSDTPLLGTEEPGRERASTVPPLILTPPPIPWDELDRRHKQALAESQT
jgi:hypothetical protein